MIDITPLAREKLLAHLTEHKIETQVRILLSSGCCGDESQLILAPGQPAPGDISVVFGPLTLCLNRDLYEQVGPVRVEYLEDGAEAGFFVACEREAADGGGCAGCTACG